MPEPFFRLALYFCTASPIAAVTCSNKPWTLCVRSLPASDSSDGTSAARTDDRGPIGKSSRSATTRSIGADAGTTCPVPTSRATPSIRNELMMRAKASNSWSQGSGPALAPPQTRCPAANVPNSASTASRSRRSGADLCQ